MYQTNTDLEYKPMITFSNHQTPSNGSDTIENERLTIDELPTTATSHPPVTRSIVICLSAAVARHRLGHRPDNGPASGVVRLRG
ncbi:hypothetical protein Hbor_34200 (plasmid) [Halogeometricum borinquense DSM 11551]|uniref:Uncharacterized protein n=1 Tax=Halogeometricum borinquense (strain ATCC 700274 / DSM 11551 / JCM 10706 / KCTC 4070 / PR3) TaxID=469382 RepID=E4NUV3_HALBP|nr:hypothetical protein Hbor_34200 [Halogeometricum borinquense DSM 11551]